MDLKRIIRFMHKSNFMIIRKKLLVSSALTICVYIIYMNFYRQLKLLEHYKPGRITSNMERDHPLLILAKGSRAGKTGNCKLPVLDPFDKSIKKFIRDLAPINCQKKYPLLFSTDLESNLIILNSTQNVYTNCCYGEILRAKRKDDEFKLSQECFPINLNETKISIKAEYIYISCLNSKNEKKEIIDMLGFVHLKPKLEAKLAKRKDTSGNEKLNVVILGLDSVSRMNFIRTNKNSYKFLMENLSAIELKGYTKVADNTFPNAIPILMGLTEEEAQKKCFAKSTYFDSCPFIWKNFSEKGYRTSYAEDCPHISIFNYGKQGFVEPPTDYYLRPLALAQYKNIASALLKLEKVCYGPRLSFQVLLDNIQKTAWTLGHKGKSYFQFVWATALNHDWVNAPAWGDNYLKDTLEWFSTTNRLNDTVLILLSDHGVRYGDIRTTIQGRIEDRMPLFYSVFPKWFEEKYQIAMKNFRGNANKLTTPFDVYETLSAILNLENIEDNSIISRSIDIMANYGNSQESKINSIPRGISLFLPIPSYRDCEMAGIPPHFCVCDRTKQISIASNKEIGNIAEYIIKQINNLLKKYPKCAQLALKNINLAQILVKDPNKGIRPRNETLLDTFVVSITTKPGNANFEATVGVHSVDKIAKQYSLDLNTISRTNRYGWESKCVKDYNVKKFCYCR